MQAGMTVFTITGVVNKSDRLCTTNDARIRNPGPEQVAILLHGNP